MGKPRAARARGVDCTVRPSHSVSMSFWTSASKNPLRGRLLVTIAPVLALSSTIQSWRLQALSGDQTWALTLKLMAELMVLNTVYWYVPALLAPPIVAIP